MLLRLMARHKQQDGDNEHIAQDNGFGIGRFAPLAVKVGKLFIGLPR